MTDTQEAIERDVHAILAAAHHAYCRDTGCFDGDDISVAPEVTATIEAKIIAAEQRGYERGALAAMKAASNGIRGNALDQQRVD